MAKDDGGEIRSILKAIAEESETLRQLRADPDKIAERFNLDDRYRQALRQVDVIIAMQRQITFDTGSTFTA
jgi:hypothetical protein